MGSNPITSTKQEDMKQLEQWLEDFLNDENFVEKLDSMEDAREYYLSEQFIYYLALMDKTIWVDKDFLDEKIKKQFNVSNVEAINAFSKAVYKKHSVLIIANGGEKKFITNETIFD